MGLEDRSLASICPPLRRFIVPGSVVLDVGCGPGAIALEVASVVERGQVIGIDSDPNKIQRATSIASQGRVENVEFRLGDATSLSFKDDFFDLVYSTHVLEHLNDRVAALREMKRVAKPDGLVICSALDSSAAMFFPPCPSMEAIYRGWARLPEMSDSTVADPGLGRRMFSLGIEAGFSSLETEIFGIPEFMATATHSEEIDKVYVQAKHHARKDHERFSLLVNAGILSKDLSDRARTELEEWKSHPGAFFSRGAGVLIVGRA